ncbi:MAG: pitrilysin family protein [Nanoarchaeota archaeon]
MNFQKIKLKNGVTVLFEKRDIPLVCYSISNPFGGAYETSDVKGVAHLFEHLLFTGTKTRNHEDISGEVEKKGGVLNAFTAQDVTTYFVKMPSEHIDIGIEIIHDILKNPTFPAEKLEKEKRVVIEEIKMFHDDPEKRVYEILESALYEKPFGEGIVGSAETVKSLSREKIMNIFKENYAPEKFIVTVVGKADIKKICKKLENDFKPSNKSYVHIPVKTKNSSITEERDGIDQAQLVIGMHVPQDEKNQKTLEVLNAYLAGGMSSKLFLEIRENHGLAYTVRGSIEREKNYSYYNIYAGTTKEALDKVKSMIIQGIKDVEKMSEKELEESKQRLIGIRRVATEESLNAMQRIIFEEISTGKAENYYKYDSKIKSVKLDEVKRLAKEIIKNYSVAILKPKK